jgi:hypothetical protein
MTPHEARYLVDLYYTMQRNRIRSANAAKPMVESEEPHACIRAMFTKAHLMENEIRAYLDKYSSAQTLGIWARSNKGVGPVIAAGLLAHIDLDRCTTAGGIWRFSGLDPTSTWGKGERRPWNARLKTLCWKIGQSFMKLHNDEDCFYGKLYSQRKAYEVERNESGGNAATAAESLAAKKFRESDTKKAYEAGMLPDGRIELRAERYAVKLFLSHYFAVGYMLKNGPGSKPPIPYAIAFGGHVHEIQIPGWPM